MADPGRRSDATSVAVPNDMDLNEITDITDMNAAFEKLCAEEVSYVPFLSNFAL